MTTQPVPNANRPFTKKIGLAISGIASLGLLLLLFAAVVTPQGRTTIVLFFHSIANLGRNAGWSAIHVDDSEQVKTFSLGERSVKLSVGTYKQSQTDSEFKEVDIDVISDGQPMPTLTYSYYVFPFSELSPGAYRLKDVDGDRVKDFVLRIGPSEPHYQFYYISSQDGQGYQTDETFQSSQPWRSSL